MATHRRGGLVNWQQPGVCGGEVRAQIKSGGKAGRRRKSVGKAEHRRFYRCAASTPRRKKGCSSTGPLPVVDHLTIGAKGGMGSYTPIESTGGETAAVPGAISGLRCRRRGRRSCCCRRCSPRCRRRRCRSTSGVGHVASVFRRGGGLLPRRLDDVCARAYNKHSG